MRFGRKFLISSVCCLGIALGACAASSAAGKGSESSPREMYESARSLAERGKYRKASKLYEYFVENYPGSPLAPEGKFRQAECLELMKDYYGAFKVYQELLEQYPTFPSTAEVLHRQLGIGTTLMNRKGLTGRNISRAREVFRKVVHNAPFGESAPRAQFNLAMTYEMRKTYSEALLEYGKVISNYPGSDAVDDADYHLALCHYKKAKRSPHDQAESAKALTALKGFLKRYPANPKAADAKVMEEEIAGRKAKALFEVAEYYEKTGSPKSAIYYYQEIIDEYPGLELARRAELKIKRDFELAQVDKRIEGLTDELTTIRDEIAYSKSQVRRLRQPEPGWHVWKYLRSPGGPKGERIAQEKERLGTLGKEAAQKKREIRTVLKERRDVHRVTAARLKLDKARRKKHLAQAELAVARDDRPGLSGEGAEDAAAQKSYERKVSRKSGAVDRASRAVTRAEKRLDSVQAGIEGARGRTETQASRKTKARKKDIRQEEYRKKVAELSSSLTAEKKNERALAREEGRQERLLRRAQKKAGADEVSEAEASLSLLSARHGESRNRIAELEQDIERRKRIHELQGRYEVAMRKERGAEAELIQVEAAAHGKKKGVFSFMKGDPLTGAVEKLDRCKKERRRLENELSALTSGEKYVSEKEKRRSDRERRTREKIEERERAQRVKLEARSARTAEKAKQRQEERAAAEKRDLERIEAGVRAEREKCEVRREKAAETERKKEEKRSARERRAREKAEVKERAKREKEEARRRKKELADEEAAAARRKRLREQMSEALRQEELAGAQLEELRATGEGRRRAFFFFPYDPVGKAEKRLERLQRRREELQRKIDGEGEAPAA